MKNCGDPVWSKETAKDWPFQWEAPLARDLDPSVFEIALVQAGAISAGAYTAGVVDFLIEALDAWEKAKAENQRVPTHRVSLRAITGASAGGMTAALTAGVLGVKVPRPDPATPEQEHTGNPLYDAWVQDIGYEMLLATDDLKGNKLRSLLNADCLPAIGRSALQSAAKAPPAKPESRKWVSPELRVCLTLSNVQGVPYFAGMKGNVSGFGYRMVLHRDSQRFVTGKPRPDEYPLDRLGDLTSNSLPESWDHLLEAALASGAFPLALQPRIVPARRGDYCKRVVTQPKGRAEPVYAAAAPWPGNETWTGETRFTFASMDGGILNNEPLSMARDLLAGVQGENPRSGLEACRATILIDPFPGRADAPPPQPGAPDLWQSLGALKTMWTDQSRFEPDNLLLAAASEVFSRFIVLPSRGEEGRKTSNGKDLACGLFDGFGGFLGHRLRVHDYVLGRRNCQRFLTHTFVLPKDNPLFKGWIKDQSLLDEQTVRLDGPAVQGWHDLHGTAQDGPVLPIIPLVTEDLRKVIELEDWPKGTINQRDVLKRALRRMDGVAAVATAGLPWLARPVVWVLRKGILMLLKPKLRAGLAKAVRDWGLE